MEMKTQKKIVVAFLLIISIILILGGIMLLVLGMIGEYVGRIYITLNNSPQYVIRTVINNEKDKKWQNEWLFIKRVSSQDFNMKDKAMSDKKKDYLFSL